jgi:hypothetical protein
MRPHGIALTAGSAWYFACAAWGMAATDTQPLLVGLLGILTALLAAFRLATNGK